jgi:transcription elongation GreA/GreB family factor
MTSEARSHLIDEVAALRRDVAIASGADPAPGVVHVPAAQAARRLVTLEAVLAAARVVDDDGTAVIGRRVTLLEDDGTRVTYALVFPGDGDPLLGWLSVESPLGAAVAAARAGDVVTVEAPAGRRHVAVVHVE